MITVHELFFEEKAFLETFGQGRRPCSQKPSDIFLDDHSTGGVFIGVVVIVVVTSSRPIRKIRTEMYVVL